MTFKGTIKIEQEEDWVVATCLENNIASQGKTIDEAIMNLKEAITLYYEDETNREELDFLQSVTGDKYLLILKKYETIKIITSKDYIEIV